MRFTADYHYGKLLEDSWVEKRIVETLGLIKNHCVSNNLNQISVLDFGGYDGNLMAMHNLLKLNIISEYKILDGDKKALDNAIARGFKADYLDLNALSEHSEQKKYDCIIATEVLEHLLNPREILSHLIRLLNPNGFIVISLPNENTIIHRAYSLIGVGPDTEAFNLYKHLHLPTLMQSRLFLSSQLNILSSKNWFHFGGNGSKIKFLSFQPDTLTGCFLVLLGNIFPNLLARGRIYLCTVKTSPLNSEKICNE